MVDDRYFEHTVEVVIRKDDELYEKMCEIAKMNDMSIEAVANLLVKVGLAIHMELNADAHLMQNKKPEG